MTDEEYLEQVRKETPIRYDAQKSLMRAYLRRILHENPTIEEMYSSIKEDLDFLIEEILLLEAKKIMEESKKK